MDSNGGCVPDVLDILVAWVWGFIAGVSTILLMEAIMVWIGVL